MPTFEADKAALLWDATAVPNAFFCEYMPSAPESHVKVYLYGLMCAHAGMVEDGELLDDVAKALNLDRTEVEQALRYWERCRLVARVKDHPPIYRFLSVQQAMFQKQQLPRDDAYESFAQAIYAAFGDRRKLHGGETVLAYEWVEQLKLPPEVVLMLIQHMIATRGVQFGFKEAQKLATELSEQHVASVEEAESLFSRSEAAWKGARKVLSRLGKRRNPSMDEIDLYVKWTVQWGFAPKAVESACAETTKGDPSFGYLDKILQGIRERSGGKTVTASQVEKQIEGERDENTRVREMLAAFGLKAPVVDDGKRLIYRNMLSIAPHEVVLLAAREVGKRRGSHSIEDVASLLSAWRDRGIATAEDAKTYLATIAAQNKRLKELFAICGKEDGCTQANREMLKKWREQWQVTEPLLDLVAEYAKNVDKPMPYMDKLLQSWHDESVTTVEAARAEHQRFADAGAKGAGKPIERGAKKLMEQQYEQREYDPNEYGVLSAEQLEEANQQ
ncbi:MAG: DnaD domain protein [Clostridia bacterium]